MESNGSTASNATTATATATTAATLFHSSFNTLPESWKYTFGSFFCVLSLLSTTENFFLLTLFWKFHILRNPSNIILMSLATTGLLLGAISAPLNAAQLLSNKVLKSFVVDVVRQYTCTVFVGVYAITLGFISLDRCRHMVKLRNYHMSYATVGATLFLTWIAPMLIPLLRMRDDNNFNVIVVFGTMLLLTLNCSYCGLLYALRKISTLADNPSKSDLLYIQNEKKAGTTVFLVVTSFTALIIPVFAYYALCSMDTYDDVTLSKSYVVGVFAALLSTAVTPFIYVIRTPALWKYMREVLGCATYRKYTSGYVDDMTYVSATNINATNI